MPSASQIFAYLPDIILIVISGLACLYCYLLSSRLRKLNNLETGVGASIVTLTRAIEETYLAAKEAQTSTIDAVKELRDLIERSEALTPKAEELVIDLERSFERARDQQDQLQHTLDVSLNIAVEKAEMLGADLVKLVEDINENEMERFSQDPLPEVRPRVHPYEKHSVS